MPFNPYQQDLTGLMADGVTPLIFNMADLDFFLFYSSRVCINYGTQMGASILMFIVVLISTHENKRSSPLLFLNLLSLALSALRSFLSVLYYTNQWTELYANWADDYSGVPQAAYATSVATDVISALFLLAVEISLLMQTRVVCVTLEKRSRFLTMGVSYGVVVSAVVFRTIVMIGNCIATIKALSFNVQWALSGALVTETLSIWYFCLVFVIKLGCTIRKRKQMGLKQFGPMQIICIMGGCTMVIPCKSCPPTSLPRFSKSTSNIPSNLCYSRIYPQHNFPNGLIDCTYSSSYPAAPL